MLVIYQESLHDARSTKCKIFGNVTQGWANKINMDLQKKIVGDMSWIHLAESGGK